MRNRATWAGVLFTALLGVGGNAEGETPRINRVRFGYHPTYDRIVVELSHKSAAVYIPTAEKEETLIEITALIGPEMKPIPAGLRRIHTLAMRPIKAGTRIQVIGTGGPVRTFLLNSPPRLIIDLADPAAGPLPMPGDVEVIPFDVGGLRAILAPRPPPSPPAPEPVVERVPLQPEPSPEPALGIEPAPEPEPEPSEAELSEPEPTTEPPELGETEPWETRTPETPSGLEGLPPPPGPVVPIPEPSSPAPDYDRWLAVAVWVGGPLLLFALGLYLARGRRRLPGPPQDSRTPESITGGEILAASDRLDLLEKRIDEEVRSRMNLERRVVEVQQDLKVVRDRVSRIARRGEEVG
jgi:hypothetical protein